MPRKCPYCPTMFYGRSGRTRLHDHMEEAHPRESIPDDGQGEETLLSVITGERPTTAVEVIPPSELEVIFNNLVEYVQGKSWDDIDEQARDAIRRVVSDQRQRLQLVVAALAVEQVDRLNEFMQRAELVEEELYKDDRIRESSTSELVALCRHIADNQMKIVDFLERQSDKGEGLLVPSTSREKAIKEGAVEGLPKDPRDRESLRMAIDGLRKVFEKINATGQPVSTQS